MGSWAAKEELTASVKLADIKEGQNYFYIIAVILPSVSNAKSLVSAP